LAEAVAVGDVVGDAATPLGVGLEALGVQPIAKTTTSARADRRST
jgi:hypothetical protein